MGSEMCIRDRYVTMSDIYLRVEVQMEMKLFMNVSIGKRYNKVPKLASFAALISRDVASLRPLARRYIYESSDVN